MSDDELVCELHGLGKPHAISGETQLVTRQASR